MDGTNWTEDPATITATNVADTVTVKVRASVESSYEGYVEGTQALTILKRPVTFTGKTATLPYTRSEIELTEVTPDDGLLDGHTHNVEYSAKGTLAGEYPGEITDKLEVVIKDADGKDVTKNYSIVTIPGMLTIVEPVGDSLVVTKTDNSEQKYDIGNTVTFTINVTNIYNETKTITISELEGVEFNNEEIVRLGGMVVNGNAVFENVAAGGKISIAATYMITEDDILAGKFTNVVTVEFSDVEREYTATDTVDTEQPYSELSKVKTTLGVKDSLGNYTKKDKYSLDDEIWYKIVVTNKGNVTVSGIVVHDEMTKYTSDSFDLMPGYSETLFTSYVVKSSDILNGTVENYAEVTGGTTPQPTPGVIPKPSPEPVASPTPDTIDKTEEVKTMLDVNKEAINLKTTDKVQIGDQINYRITVTNGGNVSYPNVVVEDQLQDSKRTVTIVSVESNKHKASDSSWYSTDGSTVTITELQVREIVTIEASYVVDASDLKNHQVYNKVQASGDPVGEKKPEDSGEVTHGTANPDLILTKTGSVKDVRPGDTFTYTLTLTNKGEGKATSVVVMDKLPEQIEFVRLLTSGMKADVDNGGVLTWNIDEIAGANEDGTATEMTLEFEVKVKSEDVLKDTDLTISNTAKITSQTIPDDTDEAKEETAIARVDVQKAAQILNPDYSPKNGDQASLGDIIRFNVVVTNKGGCELNNVVVSDIMIGKAIAESIKVEPSEAAVFNLGRSAANGSEVMVLNTLPVGQTATFTYDYRVTEEDILKGSVSNVATADAQTENGTEVTGKGETNTTTDKPAPSLTIDKALAPKTSGTERTSYRIGEAIQYLITVTNTGNVTVNNVEVTDYLTSPANPAGKVETIKLAEGVAPGESVTVEYAYTVTGEDVLPPYAEDGETVLKHFVYNYATVEGTGVDENKTLCTAESEMVTAEAEHLVLIRFIDSQTGTVLKGEYIPYGGSLTPPREREVPDYPGYYFDGWWGGVWENAYTDQNIFTNYVRREGWYPPRENDNGTGIIDAEIPLAGGYISNVGDCFD